MSLKLFYSILSLVIVFGVPVLFNVYLRKKMNIRPGFWNVLVGIVITFLCKDVFLNVVMVGIGSIPAIANLFKDSMMIAIFNIFLTVTLLVMGYLVVRKVYYHGHITIDQACGFALGATIAEFLLSSLSAALSNVIYVYQTANGTLYNNLILTVTPEMAETVINTYNNMPNSYFIYIGISAIAIMCSNYLITMIFMKTESSYMFVLILLLTTTVFYFSNPLTVSFSNVSLVVFSMILFIFAHLNCKSELSNKY